MYSIECSKCKSIIKSFSVLHNHISFRTDYTIIDGKIIREDREYFSGHAVKVIFTCPKCGDVVTPIEECPGILDFGKNIESAQIEIDGNFIKQGYLNFTLLKNKIDK